MTGALAPAAVAAALLILLVAGAAIPGAQVEPPPLPADAVWHGGLAGLPAGGTLLVAGPVVPYGADEVAAVRAFVAAGGRLAVADLTPAAVSLVLALGVGLEPRGSQVFDPDVDGDGRFRLAGVGLLAPVGGLRARSANLVLGGEPLLVTGPFTWEDRNADGTPQVGEPRGSWPVAARARLGTGEIVVLGVPGLLADAQVRAALAGWLQAPLVADQGHRASPDPVGMAAVLSGEAAPAAWAAVAATAGLGLLAAWRTSLQPGPRRARRRRGVDRETLETLAELEG